MRLNQLRPLPITKTIDEGCGREDAVKGYSVVRLVSQEFAASYSVQGRPHYDA